MMGRRLTRWLGRLGACKGLPQGIDRACEISNLLGQPLGIGLLGRQQALHGLQLVLNDL